MGKGIGAVALGAVIVGGAALWNTLKRKEAEQEPQIIYVSNPQSSGNDGWKAGLINFGVDALFGALDGVRGQAQPGGGVTYGGGNWLSDLFGGGPVTGTDDFTSSANTGGGTGGLLDMIGRHESRGDYNVVYGGSKIQPPRPITTMTVGEVMAYQQRSIDAGSASSAVGKYQTLRRTLGDAVSAGVVSLDEPYDPGAQDRVGMYLLNRRGLQDYQSGRISEATFAQNLSKEWASLPAFTRDRQGRSATGQSYYAGDGLNRALTTKEAVLASIRGLKSW